MPKWGVATQNLHPCLSDYNFCVLLIRTLVDPPAIQSKAMSRRQEAKVCWRSPQTQDHRQGRTTGGTMTQSTQPVWSWLVPSSETSFASQLLAPLKLPPATSARMLPSKPAGITLLNSLNFLASSIVNSHFLWWQKHIYSISYMWQMCRWDIHSVGKEQN